MDTIRFLRDKLTPRWYEAQGEAHAWLVAHGYSQFSDGVWQIEGCPACPYSVLSDYIEEKR